MNTQTDGLYGTTLYKRKTLMNVESAKPAVDQPVAKVDVKQVRKMFVGTLTLWLGPQLPRWSLLLYPNKKYGFTSQKRNIKDILQFIYTKEETKFSRMRT
jgi:hypothetical protein